MRTFRRMGAILVLLVLVLAACGSGERAVTLNSVVEQFDFETSGQFEEDDFGAATLRIADGQYEIELFGTDGIFWGQQGQIHTNVAVEVSVTSNAPGDGILGVMCRADPANNGNSYIFTYTPGGTYVIARGDAPDSFVLVSGTTDAIAAGENTVRAVCVDTYLGLYINDTFVAVAEDGTYTSGLPGLVAGRGTFIAAFDDLTVYQAGFAE